MTRLIPCLLLAGSFLALMPRPAHAASGWVEGYLKHYQAQGDYCPTTRDCTGAQYLQAEFQTYVPVRRAYVYLRDQNGVTIGTGTTDSNGYYKFSWWRSTAPTNGSVIWTLKHADGRFQVHSPSGATYILWFNVSSITDGTTSSSPQNFGIVQWGSPGAPHQLTNVFDGAQKMWDKSLKYSSLMVNYFPDVDIRALSNTVPNSCKSSCANGPSSEIQLDANAAYEPQARIMHEMGHIASYVSAPFTAADDYCYPTGTCAATDPQAGWYLTSTEWRSASFEEGLATFFGDTAIYWYSNPQPHTCLKSQAPCTLNTYNVETSTGVGFCGAGEGRWALSVDRYLRDMYDTVNDSNYAEAMHRNYFEFFDVVHNFATGTNNHERDEPWNSTYTVLDSLDGRSACDDFQYNFNATTGLVTTNQCDNNCDP